MPRRVHVHLGAPETGTTTLQAWLHRNAALLLQHGVLVPRADDDAPARLARRAALELTGHRPEGQAAVADGSWAALVDQVTSYDGTVIVSDETFVACDDAAVATMVAAFDTDTDSELHVVHTARTLGDQLVAEWLEGLTHGGTDDLTTHLARARAGELPPSPARDVPTVLARWLRHLPAERIHVVTAPSDGDGVLLWRRFAEVVGIDEAWVPGEPARAVESVGIAEAQVLRALNEALGGSSRRGREHHRVVRHTVIGAGLLGREGDPVELPPGEQAWAADEVEAWISWLAGSGVDVVGDLDELRAPTGDPSRGVDPDAPHPGTADAAVAALTAVIIHLTQQPAADS